MKHIRKAALATALVGALMSSNSGAVNLATDGIGEVAIAPYYTVRGGWVSLINLTNTSRYPTIVKVRFHEAYNSRDVQDFLVALSANDVFSAILRKNAAGDTVLEQTDRNLDGEIDTCTIPDLNVFNFNLNGQLAYTGTNNDGGPQGVERLQEGYIEFVNMGFATDNGTSLTPLIDGVGHAIETGDCDIVNEAFLKSNIVNTARQFGEPLNDLKYNYRLLNADKGLEIGGAAVTWANFFNPEGGTGDPTVLPGIPAGAVTPEDNQACTIDRGEARRNPDTTTQWNPADAPGADSCLNLITAQQDFDFLEPSLNDAYPVVANRWDDQFNVAVSIVPTDVDTYRVTEGPVGLRGVDAVSQTIQRAFVVNEWADNPSLNTETNWVLTFPTKLFYVDQRDQVQAAMILDGAFPIDSELRPDANYINAPDDPLLAPYPPFAEAFDESSPGAQDGQSCNVVSYERFDRAELGQLGSDGTIPSPAPPAAQTELCYEVNIIDIQNTNIFDSQVDQDLSIGDQLTGAINGWIRASLVGSEAADADQTISVISESGTTVSVPGGLNGYSGLPTIGLLVKTRVFEDASLNFASFLDHGYVRDPDPVVIPAP